MSLDESILDETVAPECCVSLTSHQPALAEDEPVDSDEHHALARPRCPRIGGAAEERWLSCRCSRQRGSMVAVIGEFAPYAARYQGAGSSAGQSHSGRRGTR